MIELSVVLISKNQAWNISRLVESVLQATSSFPSAEVILVDSNSADETVAFATHYPINIMRLRPGQRLSPAAGRYIGYKRTRGEFILFLDGDMEMLQGWLGPALQVMREMPEAGVMLCSKVIELSPAGASAPPEIVYGTPPKEVSHVSFVVGGAALYRRSVLEHVGSFNPFLYSDEEPELYLRIRYAGYRVLQLDSPIVRHYSQPQETPSALLGRRKRNFLLGVGQCIRYHLGTKLLWPYLRERALWSLTAVLWLAAGLGSLLWTLMTQNSICFGLWTLLCSLLLGIAAVRKRSLRRAFYSFFHRVLMVEGLFRGFLMKPLAPDTYPSDVEVIKEMKSERSSESRRRIDPPLVALSDIEEKNSATIPAGSSAIHFRHDREV